LDPASEFHPASNGSAADSISSSQPQLEEREMPEHTVGFFIPEQWLSEDGRPKPRAFCGFLQAMLSQIVQSAGTTLKDFAPQYQLFYGEQSIRRLLFWLRDLGAVRIFRITQQPKPSLFSPPPTYSISGELNYPCIKGLMSSSHPRLSEQSWQCFVLGRLPIKGIEL
uniref:NYN domain and retroviral integrase containing n=1 Tax=Echinostoma caproni TaxID=27848 RepID=A0A183B5J7_9TREM